MCKGNGWRDKRQSSRRLASKAGMGGTPFIPNAKGRGHEKRAIEKHEKNQNRTSEEGRGSQ